MANGIQVFHAMWFLHYMEILLREAGYDFNQSASCFTLCGHFLIYEIGEVAAFRPNPP